MCRQIEEEVEPTVGLPRHRHFVGFFNVPVQTPTRDPPFYGYSEKPPHFSRLLRHAWGYGGHILDFNPRVPTRGFRYDKTILNFLQVSDFPCSIHREIQKKICYLTYVRRGIVEPRQSGFMVLILIET